MPRVIHGEAGRPTAEEVRRLLLKYEIERESRRGIRRSPGRRVSKAGQDLYDIMSGVAAQIEESFQTERVNVTVADQLREIDRLLEQLDGYLSRGEFSPGIRSEKETTAFYAFRMTIQFLLDERYRLEPPVLSSAAAILRDCTKRAAHTQEAPTSVGRALAGKKRGRAQYFAAELSRLREPHQYSREDTHEVMLMRAQGIHDELMTDFLEPSYQGGKFSSERRGFCGALRYARIAVNNFEEMTRQDLEKVHQAQNRVLRNRISAVLTGIKGCVDELVGRGSALLGVSQADLLRISGIHGGEWELVMDMTSAQVRAEQLFLYYFSGLLYADFSRRMLPMDSALEAIEPIQSHDPSTEEVYKVVKTLLIVAAALEMKMRELMSYMKRPEYSSAYKMVMLGILEQVGFLLQAVSLYFQGCVEPISLRLQYEGTASMAGKQLADLIESLEARIPRVLLEIGQFSKPIVKEEIVEERSRPRCVTAVSAILFAPPVKAGETRPAVGEAWSGGSLGNEEGGQPAFFLSSGSGSSGSVSY